MGKIAKIISVETKPIFEPVKTEPDPDYNAIRKQIREANPELNERFDKIKYELSQELIPMNYKIWIEPLVAVKYENGVLILFHEPFHAGWVMDHFKARIEEKTKCGIQVVSEVSID